MNEIARQMIDDIVEMQRKKLAWIQELLDLSKKQELSLNSGSYHSLLDQIKHKQEVIEKIDHIDRVFYTDFLKLKRMLNVESMEDIDVEKFPNILLLKRLVQEIMDELCRLQELDFQNKDEVQKEIEKVKSEMKSLNHQVRANKSYANGYKTETPGFFVDGKK